MREALILGQAEIKKEGIKLKGKKNYNIEKKRFKEVEINSERWKEKYKERIYYKECEGKQGKN